MANKLTSNNKFVDTNLLMSKVSLNGLTKSSFAEACGISRSTVTNIFNKDIRVDNVLISKIYVVLDLTPQEAEKIFFTPNLRNTKVLEMSK